MALAKALVHFYSLVPHSHGLKKHNLVFSCLRIVWFQSRVSQMQPSCGNHPKPAEARSTARFAPILWGASSLSRKQRMRVGVDSSVSRRVGGGRGRKHCPEDCLPPSHAGGCSAPKPEAYPFRIPSRPSLVGKAVRVEGPTDRGMSDDKRRGGHERRERLLSPRLPGRDVVWLPLPRRTRSRRPQWLDRRWFASSKAPDRGGSRGD